MTENHETGENQRIDSQIEIPTVGILTPSRELAWIIGTLSGKGAVNNRNGEISLGNKNEQVQEEFVKISKQVFGVDIPYGSLWTSQGRERITYLAPSFFSIRIARALGYLSRTEFPGTIEDRHSWILHDEECTLRYIEGLYEARGNVYNRAKGASKDIIFQTSFPHVSEFISNILKKIGITPSIINQRIGSQLRTRGVTVSTLIEQQKFAKLVHSKDSVKEAQLEEFRQASTEGAQVRVKSENELIEEWGKMIDILGYPPNMHEINVLYHEGRTRWSHQAYIEWFGATEKNKRFSVARRRLISITYPYVSEKRLNTLAKRHRTGSNQVGKRINKEKLRHLEVIKEREEQQRELEQSMAPSKELAWVLGLLVAAGTINSKNGSIILRSIAPSIQNEYIRIAGNLFRTNLSWCTIYSKTGEHKMPQYNSTRVARRIGDLRRAIWPNIISEKYSWIMKDQNLVWAFLSGIFDDKGVFTGSNKTHVVIPTSFRKVANFIAELMTSVGIQNPLVVKSNDWAHKEGVQGVAITNIRDLKKLANNIHSIVPEKEQKLELIRTDTARKPRNLAPLDENILIAEWKRMYKALGHIPNVTDIAELYATGKTPWSSGVYARVFGPTGTNKGRSYEAALAKLVLISGLESNVDGSIKYRRPDSKYKKIDDMSKLVTQYRQLREKTLKDKAALPVTSDFDKARTTGLINYSRVTFANCFGQGSLAVAIKRLEDLIVIEDVNNQLRDYEAKSGWQVKYVTKIHPTYSFELRERLNEIINNKQLRLHPFLLGKDGKPLIITENILVLCSIK